MSSGLSIGGFDATQRPRLDWPPRSAEQNGHNDELGLDELIKACGRMRAELQEAVDPRHQVALLRRMAHHREAIARLDRRGAPADDDRTDSNPAESTQAHEAQAHQARAHVRPTGEKKLGEAPVDSGDDGDRAVGGEAESVADAVEVPAQSSPEQPLTLRYLVEGPPRSGTTTIIGLLSQHFETEPSARTIDDDGLTVHWLEFSAGSFEGRPIRFEVCSVSGSTDRSTRRYVRSLVDAIIFVVEATADGLATGLGRFAETTVDRMSRNELDRPALTIFAHKVDLPRAVDPTEVALGLGLDEDTKIVATTRERSGSTHGLALATSSALRRVQRRDASGRPRTVGLAHAGFLTLVRGGLPIRPVPSTDHPASARPAAGPDPAPMPEPDAVRPEPVGSAPAVAASHVMGGPDLAAGSDAAEPHTVEPVLGEPTGDRGDPGPGTAAGRAASAQEKAQEQTPAREEARAEEEAGPILMAGHVAGSTPAAPDQPMTSAPAPQTTAPAPGERPAAAIPASEERSTESPAAEAASVQSPPPPPVRPPAAGNGVDAGRSNLRRSALRRLLDALRN